VFARCSPHGAIFLDEIGELKSAVQVKLLRVLQERTFVPVGSQERMRFRGRVICATNRELSQLRSGGFFRDDFFYRISSDVITVPPLRERLKETPEEIELLLRTILERMAGQNYADLLQHVRDCLQKSPGVGYDWPGNVRELEQAVRRILLTGKYEPRNAEVKRENGGLASRLESLELTPEQLLAEYCDLAVRRFGTRAAAARRLGMDARTLHKYLGRLIK
jgi:transcriptional regulator with PAS, ATPase and Fis domain